MEYDWLEMMERMQDIRLFCSLHVRRAKKGGISSSQELDLLSRVALSKEKLTSHMLCTGMGISKPVVSRLVESLCRKEFLEKEMCAADHRSYYLCITGKGREELERTYTYYLEPLYSMRRRAGEETFSRLMELIRLVNHQAGEYGETKQSIGFFPTIIIIIDIK